MGLEVWPDQTPEALSFANVSNRDLAIGFTQSRMGELDLAAGRELSRRLHGHAGCSDEQLLKPLVGLDGQSVLDNGQPLTRHDYVNWAARHHPHALGLILRFLFTEPGEPKYEAGRAVFADYDGSQPPTDRD